MRINARAWPWFGAILVVIAALGAFLVWALRSEPTGGGWHLAALPGSEARIATFPELVKLSSRDLRPAAELSPPFTLDSSPKPAVTPTIEKQTLLGADTYAPRAPREIVVAYGRRMDLTDDERDALVRAYLDLGQFEPAAAAHRARVAQKPRDEKSHQAWLAFLDEQNRPREWLAAADAYFGLLLESARQATAAPERQRLAGAAKALLEQRAAITQRALLDSSALETAQLQLIDAFPTRADLLVEYVRGREAWAEHEKIVAVLEPRLSRYRIDREELWNLLAESCRKLGQLDRLLRLLEPYLAAPDNEDLIELYGRVLRDANLVETRRAQLQAAFDAAPSAVNLYALALLSAATDQPAWAREQLAAHLPKIGRAAADELLRLSSLAAYVDAPNEAAALAIDAALTDAERRPERLLQTARRLRLADAPLVWPLQSTPAAAFQLGFVDNGPGVIGGLVSLGTNRLGARDAMRELPKAGARYANQRLAAELALSVADQASDPAMIYDAAWLAVSILQKAGQAEAVAHLADRTLARLGARHEMAGWVLLWHADAAKARKDVEGEIAALRRAAATADQVGSPAAAAEAQRRLEQRLIEKRRYPEALALKWERVERMPSDEKAMDDLLAFAERHKLFEDETRAYRLAIERFDRRTWSDKFARWLLRKERRQDFEALVLETAAQLGENELSAFLTAHLNQINSEHAGALFFEKVFTIALQRFPANAAMNLHLLDSHERLGFAANRPSVTHQDRFLDLAMRCLMLNAAVPDRLLRRLGQRGMLNGVIAKLEANATRQPAEAYLWTRAQQFLARYENAAAGYGLLAAHWPNNQGLVTAQATLARSLADSFHVHDPALYTRAAELHGRLAERYPLATADRVLQGETLLEAGRPREAATAWERLPAAAPGDSSRWLDLATLYWDYFQPLHAMEVLAEARRVTKRPHLFAKEMGYLLEDRGRLVDAVNEFIEAVLLADEGGFEVSQRLFYLVNSKKIALAAVDAAFRRRLTGPAGTSQEAATYVQWLRDHGLVEQAKQTARALLPQYADTVLAERAYELFVEYGDDAGTKASLDRLIEISRRDPAMIRRLVAYHENRKELDAADALVEGMAARDGSPDAKRDALAYAAEYFWRTERRDRALDYYRRQAEQSRRQPLHDWVIYADRCLQAERQDLALDAMTKLRRAHPLDPALLRVMAGAYAARSDRAGLVTLYRDALKDLRQAALEPQAKKDREIDLRRLLAAALTDMGLPRDALEEHIQIVNRLAPDVESVVLAFRFAQQHNLVPVLAAHYEREVERASRDFRWQFVTALLYEAQGRYADAARLLAKASANEPQRLDLLERRATALIKAGDFDGAVAVYRTLAGRRLKGEDYQLRVAEVLYLAGKPQDAESWLDQILAAPDVEPTRVAAAARLAQRFGRELAERKYTQQAVQLVLAEPDRREIEADILQIWLRGQLETSGVERTLAALADMRQKLQQAKVTMHPVGRQRIEKTLQALDGLVSRGFVDWLRAHADGPARQAAAEPFAALLMEPIQNAPLNKRKAAYLEAITAAQGAQLPEVAERFYRQFTKEWHALIGGANDKPAAAETLVSTGKTRARTEPLAALNAEWQSLPAAPAPAHAPWTHLQAVLARAAGDEAAERLALERWFNAQRPNKKFVAPDPLTARYFSLLDDARLDEFAHGDCRLAGPLVLWLARQGQTTRLIAALDHHYRDKGPQWLLAKKALAYQGDPKYRPATGQAYVELLGLPLTVGTLVGAKAPPARVTERNWTHYADRYAQWLAQQQDAAGFHLLFARPERSPTSAEAYLHVVDNLDRAERFTAADYFLAQAEQLGEERKLIVARARHWQAQGKTGQAATELARLVQPAPVSLDQWSNYAHLMGEIDRAAAGLERWQQGVVEALPRLSNYSRRDVLQQLLEFAEARLGEKRAAAVARDVLSAFPFTAEDLRAMLDNDALPEPVVSWAWSQALDRLDRDPRATVYAKYSLADGALTQALTVKDKGLIRRALASLEKTNPREFDGDPMRLRRLQASIVLDGAKASEALATRFVTGRTDHGLIDDVWQTLRDAGWPDAADRVWLAFYEPIRNDPKMATRYVSDDSTDGETRDLADADLTTLGAYLRLGQAAKARTLLTELEGAAGTNASSLTAIADVLLTNRALNEAVRLADRAAALFPMNRTTHQTRLLIYLAAGRTDEAARQLSTGWQAGIYSRQELQSVLHQLATEAAHGKYTGRWDESAKALPTPLRELVRAELAVVRGRGEDAVQILAGLAEPYRYPSLVWRLRAEAHRLAGKAALEYAAWSAYLRYFPADIQAQDRLAWLELGHRPIAGLTRLACQRMPLAPWEQADPLIVTGAPLQRLRQWWNGVAKQDRAEMALAVIDAFVAIDRPAAGLAVGQAAVTSLRDGAPAKLRDRVKQLAKEIDQRRAAQPSRFLPNENLVQ